MTFKDQLLNEIDRFKVITKWTDRKISLVATNKSDTVYHLRRGRHVSTAVVHELLKVIHGNYEVVIKNADSI